MELANKDLYNLISLVIGTENEVYLEQHLNLIEYLQHIKVNNELNKYIILYKYTVSDNISIISKFFNIKTKKVKLIPENCLFIVYRKDWLYE